MQLCLNQITVGRQPPVNVARDLAAMREGGWTAIEVWLRHWDAIFARRGLAAARRLLDDAGLVAAGACGQPGLFFSEAEELSRFQSELAHRLEQCQALGAPHLVITPGTPGKQLPEQLSETELERAAARLRIAGDLAARYGVRLGIEFLKGVRLVNCLTTALALARRTDHPMVGVLVDTFHLYAGPSKLEDLDLLDGAAERLTFVHVNDVPAARPRELWTDADRVLPGEGTLPLSAVFQALWRTGYQGYVSLELFNDAFAARWADEPVAAARAAHEATVRLLEE